MVLNDSCQCVDASDRSASAGYWLQLSTENPKASAVMELAYNKKLDLLTVAKILHCVLSSNRTFNWGLLRNPSTVQAVEMGHRISSLADQLESGSIDEVIQADSLVIVPDLVSVALFFDTIPCSIIDSIFLLGRDEVILRLRSFSRFVNSSVLIN